MSDLARSSEMDLKHTPQQPSGLGITPLDRLRRSDRGAYGGKAAFLGEMMSHGLRVPRGVAISTAAYEAALGKHGSSLVQAFWHLPTLDSTDNRERGSELASNIEQLLQTARLDHLVA